MFYSKIIVHFNVNVMIFYLNSINGQTIWSFFNRFAFYVISSIVGLITKLHQNYPLTVVNKLNGCLIKIR